jgi:outer membrane scaffolding protein for murein synthesis (MipA/OmpV family)
MLNAGLAWQMTAGVRYASASYHAYYYDVPVAFATATRAQFSAGSGFSGGFADVTAAWREDSMIYWAFVRYQNLSGAVFENSPLVEQKDYYFFGLGLSWIFAHSL